MPRNASGTYSLPNPPVVPDDVILAADENTTRNDLASEITNSLDRSARGGMLAELRLYDGIITVPGLAFSLDVDTGLYREATNTMSASMGGVKAMRWNTITSGVNYVDVWPAVTTAAPYVAAAGSDTNISLEARPKGTGKFTPTDGTDVTKKLAIDVSGVATGTTRTLKMSDTDFEFFAAGTRMLFQQTSAPTGWTKEASATYNDAALRFTTGTVGTGGADAFNTLFGTSKSTASHTLATSEIPAHSHAFSSSVAGGLGVIDFGQGGGNGLAAGVNLIVQVYNTNTDGGSGGGHSHTLSNMNLKFADCIIAAKN